jgi:hypothetical protein
MYGSDMDELAVLEEINRLLDVDYDTTVNTSMRLPSALRDAAAFAVERLDAAPSATTMAATALRQALETLVMETALRLHYHQHPEAKPSLAEVALALASQDGSPLADRPTLIAAAADAVVARHPGADADDVLLERCSASRSGRARRASSVEKLPRPLDDDPKVIVGEVEKIVVAGDDDIHFCRQRERDEVVVIRIAAYGLWSRLRVALHVGESAKRWTRSVASTALI